MPVMVFQVDIPWDDIAFIIEKDNACIYGNMDTKS